MSVPAILVVDGDVHSPDSFAPVMMRLWFKEWTTGFAAGRAEALRLLGERPWDLVCMNLALPPEGLTTHAERVASSLRGEDVETRAYRNGIVTAAAIHRVARRVPIIAWTLDAMPSHTRAAQIAGVSEVVDCRAETASLRREIEKWAKLAGLDVRHAA